MAATETDTGLLGDEQRWTGRIYGEGWTDAPEQIEVLQPATGEVIAHAGVADAGAVASAAASAAAAQPGWAATPFPERARILRRAADLLEEHADEITRWMLRETGSILPKIAVEITNSANQLHQATGLVTEPLAHVLPTQVPDRTSVAHRIPVGVVGVITPWNFPIVLALRSLAPALALGNAVVMKSDPNTPVTGGVVIARIFEEAGLPPGVLHVFSGGAEVGQALVADANVAMVSFTGSARNAAHTPSTPGYRSACTAPHPGGRSRPSRRRRSRSARGPLRSISCGAGSGARLVSANCDPTPGKLPK